MSEPNQKSDSSGPAAPKSFCGSLTCLFICAAIVAIVYILHAPRKEEPRRLWTPFVVETNGAQTALGESRQMEFWTPSAKTRDFLAVNGVIDDKHKWENIASDDVVMKFGNVLHSNANVVGFRRVEVWGQGRTGFKPGWWWYVNVTTNCPVSDVTRAYQEFWKPPTAIFIELIDNRGSDN